MQVQAQAQSYSGSDESCTSLDESDANEDRYDGCYSNSTHQAEYTDVSDYEDVATSSELDDELPASLLAVCACFSSTSELFKQDPSFLPDEKSAWYYPHAIKKTYTRSP